MNDLLILSYLKAAGVPIGKGNDCDLISAFMLGHNQGWWLLPEEKTDERKPVSHSLRNKSHRLERAK